jgi:dihydrofolate reductase
MGRKTFESLPNGPLKNRINIVITNQTELYDKSNETLIYTNFSNSFEIFNKLQKETHKEIFIIGGNTIYNQYFEYCTKFHISLIDNEQHGDTIFPYNIQYFHTNFHLLYNETLFTSKNEHFTYHIFEKRNII